MSDREQERPERCVYCRHAGAACRSDCPYRADQVTVNRGQVVALIEEAMIDLCARNNLLAPASLWSGNQEEHK